MCRLTQQQILNALPTLWVDVLGIDEDEAEVSPDENLIDWLKSLGDGIYEELDFADVHTRLRLDFGLDAPLDAFDEFLCRGKSDDEWERLVKPTLTIARFADWIAEHTSVPSYTPVTIGGHCCPLAGTFFGIEEVIQSAVPGASGFGPSTPILDAVRGDNLDRVWRRLRLHTEGRLPVLAWPWQPIATMLDMASVVLWGVAIAAIPAVGTYWFALAILAGAIGLALGFAIHRTGDPLPSTIKTFRDLAAEMSRVMPQ